MRAGTEVARGVKASHAYAKSLGRIVVAAVSAGAALVSILSFARANGMIGGSSPGAIAAGGIGASWVGVAPTADTVTAIGDTMHLAATVTDRAGAVLVGTSIAWSSENPRVASVGSDGTVIARGSGTTTILAAVGDKMARSRVTVRQTVSSVRLNGDSTISISDGEQAPLAARPLDARGHPVPQKAVVWTSANSEILAIDSLGIATAKLPGSTTVTATVDGVSSYVPARVVAVPAALGLVAGAEQRAFAGSALPQKVVIRVLSKRGRPVGGAAVRFRAEDGGGVPDPVVATTDADGRARVQWTLGAMPGRQRLYISVDRVDSALVVLAEAEPVAANTRATQIGAAPAGPAAMLLPDPVGIRVTDSTGRALVDVPLSWAALDGGSITGASTRTDTLGEARARWTLGPGSGDQRLRVQIGSGRAVRPATLLANATSGAPHAVVVVSGDTQKATVNARLRKAVVLRVNDKLGNPVPGARVSLVANAGSTSDSVLVTDVDGTVAIRWTMARTAGSEKLIARVEGIERRTEIVSTAVPASAANLALASEVVGGIAGKALGSPVVATVTDSYGNVVADAIVSFTAKAGLVSPSRVATDAKGRAQTRWTLGRAGGEQALVAVVKGHDVRGTLTVQATAPEQKRTKSATASRSPTARTPARSVKKPASTKRSR